MMKIKDPTLAALIRKGLRTPNVIEDSSTLGLQKREGKVYADVIGLAYIGAGFQGSTGAKIFADAFMEARQDVGDEYYRIPVLIRQELCILDPALLRSLLESHFERSAAEIANTLAEGTYVLE